MLKMLFAHFVVPLNSLEIIAFLSVYCTFIWFDLGTFCSRVFWLVILFYYSLSSCFQIFSKHLDNSCPNSIGSSTCPLIDAWISSTTHSLTEYPCACASLHSTSNFFFVNTIFRLKTKLPFLSSSYSSSFKASAALLLIHRERDS